MGRTQIATDDFNHAAPLGANWAQLNAANGTISIDSSIRFWGSGGDAMARWVGAGTFTNDQYSSVLIAVIDGTVATSRIGAIARASADTDAGRDSYIYRAKGLGSPTTFTTELVKVVNGTESVLSTVTNITWAVNDRIEIECEGTTIRGLKSGSVQTTQTDSAISTGLPGIYCQGDGADEGDDWEGGNITGGTTPITVNNLPIDSLAGGEIIP